MVVVGVIVCEPLDDTVPIAGPIETEVAPVTLQDNVADSPEVMVPGLTVKLLMDGSLGMVTVIVVDFCAEPEKLVATSVYVVVAVGDTATVPLDDTVPISGVMDTPVAPVTSHCNFACSPDVIAGELASKDATTGEVNHFKIAPFVAILTPPIVAAISSTTINATIPPELFFGGNDLSFSYMYCCWLGY